MSQVANAVEAEIMKKKDHRFEAVAGPWISGLRRRWLQHSQAGMRTRWGPHPQEYVRDFARDVAAIMRTRWLRDLCPEAVRNRACERSRAQAELPDISCTPEALDRERQEAQDRRLSIQNATATETGTEFQLC